MRLRVDRGPPLLAGPSSSDRHSAGGSLPRASTTCRHVDELERARRRAPGAGGRRRRARRARARWKRTPATCPPSRRGSRRAGAGTAARRPPRARSRGARARPASRPRCADRRRPPLDGAEAQRHRRGVEGGVAAAQHDGRCRRSAGRLAPPRFTRSRSASAMIDALELLAGDAGAPGAPRPQAEEDRAVPLGERGEVARPPRGRTRMPACVDEAELGAQELARQPEGAGCRPSGRRRARPPLVEVGDNALAAQVVGGGEPGGAAADDGDLRPRCAAAGKPARMLLADGGLADEALQLADGDGLREPGGAAASLAQLAPAGRPGRSSRRGSSPRGSTRRARRRLRLRSARMNFLMSTPARQPFWQGGSSHIRQRLASATAHCSRSGHEAVGEGLPR